jgi:hypothetical protein
MLNESWALLCEIGLWGWILSIVGLTVQTFTQKDSLDKKYALLWGAGIVVFYAFWIYGMVRA